MKNSNNFLFFIISTIRLKIKEFHQELVNEFIFVSKRHFSFEIDR